MKRAMQKVQAINPYKPERNRDFKAHMATFGFLGYTTSKKLI